MNKREHADSELRNEEAFSAIVGLPVALLTAKRIQRIQENTI